MTSRGSGTPRGAGGPPARVRPGFTLAPSRPLASALLAALLLVWGCSSLPCPPWAARPAGAPWDKPGAGALELEMDLRDCAAVLPAGPAWPAAGDCMRAKGWRQSPSAGADREEPDLWPTVSEHGTVAILGRTAALPPGFIVSGVPAAAGTDLARSGSLSWLGPGGASLELAGQRSREPMGTEPYPAPEGAFLYDRGRESGSLSWTVFCGRLEDGLYAGLGAYRSLGARSRIVVTVVTTLPAAGEPAPSGLRLTASQRAAVEEFESNWLAWLRRSFAARPGEP